MNPFQSSARALAIHIAAIATIVCCDQAAFAQQQTAPRQYSRDSCVKVRDGKAAEYAAFLRDVTTKLYKVRVEAGDAASFVIARAVEPAGRSARCDYHIVVGYDGFPPEAAGAEKTAADLKKAGIAMTRDQMLAKRDELSFLVSTDTWAWDNRVGTIQAGGYGRLNFYKVKAGAIGDWRRYETTGWKPLAEALSKEKGTSWSSATLSMPGGTALPYNALTVDGFPNWAAVGAGVPVRQMWSKVHPNSDMTAHTERVNSVADRPRIDWVRFVEVIRK